MSYGSGELCACTPFLRGNPLFLLFFLLFFGIGIKWDIHAMDQQLLTTI
jgi:hypothetical protein